MNREQFLAQLWETLGSMPEARKQDILYDYEEHFNVGLSEGKTEEEIARSLGDPRVIGNSYRIEALVDRPKEGGSVPIGSVLGAVFASLTLTFFNVVFVLGPFFGLVGVLIALWAVAVSLLFSGIAVVFAPVLPVFPQSISNSALNSAYDLFAGIGIAALGLLSMIGMWKLTEVFTKAVAAYIKFNARLVRAGFGRS